MLSRYNHSRTILLGAIALAAITIEVSAQPEYRTPKSVAGSGFEVYEATIPQIQDALTSGAVTSAELVDRYVARIDAYDQDGPRINSIRDLNLMARSIANELDRLRRKGQGGGPLFGIPIILKDNVNTNDQPTTAGSVALEGSVPLDDAFITRQRRDAGGVQLVGRFRLQPVRSSPRSTISRRATHPFARWIQLGSGSLSERM